MLNLYIVIVEIVYQENINIIFFLFQKEMKLDVIVIVLVILIFTPFRGPEQITPINLLNITK